MPPSDNDVPCAHDALNPAIGHMVGRLARHQQALANGVLLLLEELEQDEPSPTRLGQLFRVDHLAMLLRRNAASMGVLLDTTIRPTADPLPLADVLQAAVAGVEDYPRVVVSATPQLEVSSEAATDVVHLLTEVIDHSLAHTTGETTLDVHGTSADEEVLIRVANHGLAMTESSLAAVNAMLRPGSPPLAGCPESSGLYVVSRLAHRHGMSVCLEPGEVVGTTATIRIPPTLFLDRRGEQGPSDYIGRHRKGPVVEAAVPAPQPPQRRQGLWPVLGRARPARNRT